jgi:2-polyprenyl-3-methyl-5-hydroxy-6-metoxy-1,4-benzoquinol methylase
MWNHTDEAWERLGGLINPYYGVSGHPMYLEADREGPARAEFFSSGEAHIDRIFALIQDSLQPGFRPRRALDFGCGVGRLVLPIARRAEEVVAMDIATPMLEETKRNCLQAGLTNVSVCRSDDQLSAARGSFDFIHSFVVLQHIPVARGLKITERLVDLLADRGVAALHFTYASTKPVLWHVGYELCKWLPGVHMLTNVIRHRPARRPLMQMNLYPLDKLFELLQSKGCHRITTAFSNHDGHLGVMLCFQRTSTPML